MKKIFLFVAMTFMLLQNSFAQQTHWSYNVHEFEENMMCNVVVSINDKEQFNPNLEIGAFCGDDCRGAIIATKEEEDVGFRYVFYLMVYGKNGDQIRFRIYDHAQEAELDLECDYVLKFKSNDNLGNGWDPFVLKFYGTSVTTYTISASADPEDGGTVSGAGTYDEGEIVTMTASSFEHYHFVNWTEDELTVSEEAVLSFEAAADRTLVAHFERDKYNITATAKPAEGGEASVSNANPQHGESMTATATPNDGYRFVNWTENEVEVSSNATYTFTAESDRTLVANFELLPPDTYVITATADPEYGGAVSGGGIYVEDATVTLEATENAHYHFVNWTEDVTEVSTSAEYTFTAEADRTLVAHFERDKYNITATAEPAEGGEASVSNANPQHGESVTATATPNDGYRFVNWTENGLTVSEEAEFSFEAAADRDLVAIFVEEGYGYTVTVAANPANGGVVGIDNENPQYGENVTATAAPKEGYRFVNWTEKGSEVSTSAEYTFTAEADRTLVANFQKESAPVTHWTPCDPSLYEGRMSVTAILQINGEEQFTDKYEIGAFCGDECRAAIRPELINGKYVYMLYVYGENENEITFRLYDHSIQQEIDLACLQTLTFEDMRPFGTISEPYEINFVGAEIIVAADPEEGGVVSGGGFYKTGAEVTVKASRNPKYDFINWTDNGEEVSTDAEFTFNATEGVRTLVAHFETQKTHWTPRDPGLYEGRMYVDAILQINGDEQLTDMYEIGAFSGDGCRAAIRPELINGKYVYMLYVLGDDGNEITFKLYDHEADKEVTEYGCMQTLTFETEATFGTLDDPYVLNFVNRTITATAAPEAGGSVTGAGDYAYNATATLKATAKDHYHFVNWTENGEVVEGATEEYTFTVTSNRTLVANFKLNEYTITATAEPEDGGTVEGAGQHTALTEVTLTATPNAHYHFLNWTDENGEEVSTSAEYTFQALGDRTLVANFELNTYTIVAGVEPENSGKVNGEVTFTQTYTAFTDVTLTATPNEHYHFVNWTAADGTEVSTSAEYTFQALGDRTLVANFELNEYTITAGVEPENSGKVNGEVTFTHTYTAFTDVTLTATPNEHYHFLNWTAVDGTEVSTSAEYTFQALGDRTLIAHFELNEYTITATAEPEDGGTVDGAGQYIAFAEVTLTATPNEHYHFVNWTDENGEEVSTSAEYTFQALGDRELVANFELNVYTIIAGVEPENSGTVNGVVTYSQEYTAFTDVTLTATPNEHYHFLNWTEVDGTEVSTSAEYTFQALGDRTLVAHFELNTYEITATAEPEDGGTVDGADQYIAFAEVTLTATPNEHYHFVNWTDENGEEVSTSAEYTFQALGDRELVANFELNKYTVIAGVEPENSGKVNGVVTYSQEYTAFTDVTLTATPNEHYHFLNWTAVDGTEVSTSAEYTFQALGDRTLIAHFELNEYTITATAEPEDGGTVDGADQYIAFAEVTLTATPNEHYHFVKWTEGDAIVSENTEYTFQALGDRTLVAHFELNEYTIAATAEPKVGGTVEGMGQYQANTIVTLTATPNAHYHFVNWTEGDAIVSENTEYTFQALGDRDLVAHFELNKYTVIATASPVDGGTVNGVVTYSQDYTALEDVTLTAAAAEHYHFVNWTAADGTEVSTSAEYTFQATGDVSIKANFALNEYTIAATANPTVGGTVDGAGQYTALYEVTLKATANTGYHFVNWTENGTPISTNASLSFQATENRNFTANFELNSYEITVSASPAEGGSAEVDNANPQHGTLVTATATSNTHYHFVNWTENGNVVSSDATYTFTATGDRNLTANFVINIYVITASANPAEGGTVTGAGEYAPNANVTLTATANTGYHFVSWTENGNVVSTSAEYTFPAESGRSLIANFELNVYTITVAANPTLGGSAEVDNANPQHGTQVTATATPVGNYSFVNWTENGNVVSTDATYTFTATGDRNLTANFDMLVFTITATANPAEGGTIAGAGNYAAGLNVTLYANANAGYTFVSWTENGNVVSTNVSLSFPATENRNLTANFTTSTYTITATANPAEGGTATVDNANPQHGATVTATAIAGPGYHFVNWTENGTEVSADAVYVFTATGNRYLTANFVLLSYEITVSSDPEEAGTVSGGGVYNFGENVTISFTANPGYVFMGWYVDDELLSEESTYTFMAESDMDIVAKGTPDGVADNITVEASVYPNPTRDNIKIECAGMERVVITSIQGKVVYDDRVMNDHVIINMSGFAQGSYIMNIYAKDGNVTKMVTVNK